jgi:hypothetical protein
VNGSIDSDAEYAVIAHLFFPFALSRFEAGFHDWAVVDAKAGGVVTLAVTVLGVLSAVDDALNALWWLPVCRPGTARGKHRAGSRGRGTHVSAAGGRAG